MTLNSSGSHADSTNLPATTTSARLAPSHMVSNAHMRRRRSKGTIAGFTFKSGDSQQKQGSLADHHHHLPQNHLHGGGGDSSGQSAISNAASPLSSQKQSNQNSHCNDSAQQPPASICHSARLALLACENAIRLGAGTQLSLCPPGRARGALQTALLKRARSGGNQAPSALRQVQNSADGYFSLEKMLGAQALDEQQSREEDFLSSPPSTFDASSDDDDASSGDEDDLTKLDDLLNDNAPSLDDETKYSTLHEPLFTPVGTDPAAAASSGVLANNGHGKLPFNRRKISFFDSSAAADRAAARKYLAEETRKSKKREVLLLTRHLRRAQREEKEKVKTNRTAGRIGSDSDLSDQENDFQREKELAASGMSRFDGPMTPAMASAMLLESLSLNPVESLEGMAKCYEGIVHAGVAVLDLALQENTAPALNESDNVPRGRSEIVAALTLLLITSLEQASGDAILSLAKLRRMCGTPRYQRRFVQRIAPALVRPTRGAMWCLRHQHDMEPILAAVELILDSASEIFSKGWRDRGNLLLADSKRAETLNAAAMQLRNLGGDPPDGLGLGLTSHGHGHGMRRGAKFNAASSHTKDGSKGSEALAEWEVIALDRQIRVSITNIISTDWSSIASPPEIGRSASYHRMRSSSSSLTRRNSGQLQQQIGDMGPSKGILSSPMSPSRPSTAKTPISPPGQQMQASASTSSHQHPPPTQHPEPHDVSSSKPASSGADPVSGEGEAPHAMPVKTSQKVATAKSAENQAKNHFEPNLGSNGGNPSGSQTPPRSPRRDAASEVKSTGSTSPASPNVPRKTDSELQNPNGVNPRSRTQSPYNPNAPTSTVANSAPKENEKAPLSPSAPHGSSSTSSEMSPYRPSSSGSSVVSASTIGSHPANYRMLTSTAAERKRTVAACRALRAQICRFEEAFVKLHGRSPRGATERAPLASTYAQYREWKRAIRADAACRIVGFARGFLVRKRLFQSDDPAKVRFIATRRDRLGQKGQSHMLSQLSLPADIGDAPADARNRNGSGSTVASTSSNSLRYDDDSSVNSAGSGIPRSGGTSRRRLADRPDGFPMSPASRPYSPKTVTSPSTPSNDDDLTMLSLNQLQSRKRELKQQLRKYDMDFARRHGRMPFKAEKEPIRHLYETYNTLKSLITSRETEGSSAPSPASVHPQSARLSPRTMSPTPGQDVSHESPRMRARRPTAPGASVVDPSGSPPVPTPSSSSGSGGTGANQGQDLSSLRAEKGRLHQMLRSYERDFFREHNRQVSSFVDIRPVASEYRRYKEIKRAIAAAQQDGSGDR